MNLPLLVEIPAVLMPLVSRNRESFQAAVVGAEGFFAGRARSHTMGSAATDVEAGSAREEALDNTAHRKVRHHRNSPPGSR